MLTADQNFRLLQEIEESRTFLLMAYQQNPQLLAGAEARIQQIVSATEPLPQYKPQSSVHRSQSSERGISLVELILFMVIIGVALAGILAVMNRVTSRSVDTLIRKQALAVAESLLEEVQLMPFTFCDPDDANAATAVNAAACTQSEQAPLGPEAGESRTTAPHFDNVNDYDGFNMAGIRDISNTPIAPLAGYTAAIAVVNAGATFGWAAEEALRITVTVTGPDNIPVVLDGYRTRYAPNSVP